MTDALRLVRKAFTVGVVITTIAWSIGFAAFIVPLTAHAATLTAGDLIKASLPAVYYYGADGKRYVFPNEKTYKTWYSNFSSVKVITDGELAAIAIGGNATYRPGVKMVKIQTDPKVYAVATGGSLRWVKTEALASALYGANWNTQIDDVPDAFFTNYTVGADVNAASDYDKAGQMAAATTINQDKGLSSAPAGVGTGLTVSLAANNPPATTLVSDGTNSAAGSQGLAPVLRLHFAASANGAVKVKTLKIHRSGISADSDMHSAHLCAEPCGPRDRIADYSSIASSVISFNDGTALFTVPAGGSKDVTVTLDVDKDSAQGKTLAFSVNTTADLVTDGATVNGTFPLSGNTMSIAAVSDLARVQLTNATIPSAVDAGTTNKEVLRWSYQATNQKTELRGLLLKMVGTANTTDIQNVKLMDGGTQLGSTVASLASDGTAYVDLSASPLVVSAGVTKTLSVNADIVGGVNRNFEFTVQKENDWRIWDTNYNVYVLPDNGTLGSYTVLEGSSNITINAGSLTMSKDLNSPSGDLIKDSTNVTVAQFDFKANGEPVKIDNLYIWVDVSDVGAGGTGGLQNVKLLFDGTQVGTTQNVNEEAEKNFTFGSSFIVPAGTTKVLSVVADTKKTSGASHTTGATVTVSLRRDTSSSAPGTASGQTSLASVTLTAVTGNTLTFRTGSVTLTKNLSLGDYSSTNPTGVANAAGVKLASLIVTGGVGEDSDLTSFTLKDLSTARALGGDFQNLRVVRNDTGAQVGTTVGALNTTAGSYTFTPSTAIRITKSQQLVFDVYADALSSLTNPAAAYVAVVADAVAATGVTTGSSNGVSSQALNLQTIYMANAGNLTMTTAAASPLSDQLTTGQTGVELARFRFQADPSEAVNVTQVIVSANFRGQGGDVSSTSVTGSLRNLKAYDADSGALLASAASLSTANNTVTPYATFANVTWQIPKNGAKTLVVKADLSPFDDGGVPSSVWRLELRSNYTSAATAVESVTARGAGSGSSLTGSTLDFNADTDVDVLGNAMDVLKSKLAVAQSSDFSGGISAANSEQTVAKFVVSNTAAGSYTSLLKLMNFNIATSGMSLTSNTAAVKVYKNSVLAANQLATTNDCTSVGCGAFWANTTTGSRSVTTVIPAANFTSVQVAAGGTVTLIVTMDTSNASASSNDTLTVSVPANQVTWDDDANDSTTRNYTAVTTLPLSGKTVSY